MFKRKQTARKSTTQIPDSLRNHLNRNREIQSNPAQPVSKPSQDNAQPDANRPEDNQKNGASNGERSNDKQSN